MNTNNKNVEYVYPDLRDQLTIALINEIEPFKDYWYESEQNILCTMKDCIEKYIKNKNSWFLDAGCGNGRVLKEFEDYYSHILAIDPDANRLKSAEDNVKNQKISEKVIFRHVSIENLDTEKKFDVIICSHILQHVHTNSIPVILDKFRMLLKKEGLLFITTCHSTKNHDYYVKEFFEKSKFIEKTINEDEFNSFVVNNINILPTHFFSKHTASKLLERFDFKIIDFKTFHVVGNFYFIDLFVNRDRLANLFPFLQAREGRDMLIVAKLNNCRV